MKTYDVIVVGAGPGGLGACLKAASMGLKTALIERRSRLAPLARACSEGLLYEEEYHGDAVQVNRETGRIEFQKNDFYLRYTGPVRETPYFMNVSPNGNRMKIVRYDHKAIHLVYDKAQCLEENLDDAVGAGVEFLPDQTVIDLETAGETVTVHTNKESLRGRFLIAADGHNSLCARTAGFNTDRPFYGTLTNACWYIKGFEPEEPAHIHLVEGKGGPAIICFNPRAIEGEYNVMISGFSPNPRYREKFEQLQRSSVMAPYFTKVEIVHSLSCILNLFGPLENPCRDNVFIVGDAAWIGQTSNTHAALTGLKAAQCIHDALKEKKTGADIYAPYQQWWDENFACHIRPPGGNLFEELTGDELNELFSYMPDEIEGSEEPITAKKLMGAFFQKLIPEVQKKNPQLVQKIAAIQQKSTDEAWHEKRSAGFPVRKKPAKMSD